MDVLLSSIDSIRKASLDMKYHDNILGSRSNNTIEISLRILTMKKVFGEEKSWKQSLNGKFTATRGYWKGKGLQIEFNGMACQFNNSLPYTDQCYRKLMASQK